MPSLLVVFESTSSRAAKVADHAAERALDRGLRVTVWRSELARAADLDRYDGVIVVAPLDSEGVELPSSIPTERLVIEDEHRGPFDRLVDAVARWTHAPAASALPSSPALDRELDAALDRFERRFVDERAPEQSGIHRITKAEPSSADPEKQARGDHTDGKEPGNARPRRPGPRVARLTSSDHRRRGRLAPASARSRG